MADVARTAIGPDARLPTRRTLEERLVVRWPGVYAALARAVQGLPPRSRLRRTLLARNALSGWGAWVRGDLDLCVVRLRARTTGIELDWRLGQVFWFEDGLIARERDFADWDEA